MKKNIYDVAVIGGGAAGLMACYALREYSGSVILIEKEQRTGRQRKV